MSDSSDREIFSARVNQCESILRVALVTLIKWDTCRECGATKGNRHGKFCGTGKAIRLIRATLK